MASPWGSLGEPMVGSKHTDAVGHLDCLQHQPVRMDTSYEVLDVPDMSIINPFVPGLWTDSGAEFPGRAQGCGYLLKL